MNGPTPPEGPGSDLQPEPMTITPLMRSDVDPQAFVSGIALFDEMLRLMERAALDEAAAGTYYLLGEVRESKPLVLHLLPLVEQLIGSPNLAPGFAAALGDYAGQIQDGTGPAHGAQFPDLRFDEVWLPEPKPVQPLRPVGGEYNGMKAEASHG